MLQSSHRDMMEPEWGVIIGGGLGALAVELYLLIKGIKVSPANRWVPALSIVCGLLFIVPFLCLVGLTLGFIARNNTVYRKTAALGLLINGFFCLVYAWLLINRLVS